MTSLATALLRPAWVRTFASGLALYVIVAASTAATSNVHLVPSLLMLGALLVPVTFVVFAYERLSVGAELVPSLASCFVVGGLVGTAAAALFEYETLLNLGVLPMLAVGLIEESVKLVLPLVLFVRRRFAAPSAGLLFGVAAGMGFASFETMGYGLAELIKSHGHLGATETLLAIRGLLSPAGHAAWTGLVCAALWRARASGARGGSLATLGATFLFAVLAHALWDVTGSTAVRLTVAAVSFALLVTQIRAARVPRRLSPSPHKPTRPSAALT